MGLQNGFRKMMFYNHAQSSGYSALHGKQQIFIGDSITYGYNATQNKNCWVSILAQLCGFAANNLGVAGKRVDNFDWAGVPVKGVNNKYAFIALGINDLFEASISAANFKATYQTKIDFMINTKGFAAGDLILVTLYYVNPTAYAIYTGGNLTKHLQFNTAVQELATSNGCKFADIYTAMSTASEPTKLVAGVGDYIHPTDRGHSFIANWFDKFTY